MGISKAIFKFNNGDGALLCSKCSKIIKTGRQFSEVEKLAMKGTVTLLAQYCDEHNYMDMDSRKGITEKLREGTMRKNILEIAISRPTQELIIMRGIPGSGDES